MTFKNIKNNGKTFLLRFSKNCKVGSIKIHIILDDDVKPHTHPWDFKSVILFGGYNETTYDELDENIIDFVKKTWQHDASQITRTYGWLSVNKKQMNVKHLVKLRRLFGFKIPTITVGRYGEKKQLCSLCQELGYCKSKK